MDQTTHRITPPSFTRIVEEHDAKGIYEIDALYPGYGNTLGNSIRRILLSSLPGAAITRVSIEGASHEFSTLENVMEDVITILLNFKQLRFRLHGDEPQTATIHVRGAKDIKGKDVECPSQLEIVNKDHHIATLSTKNAEFRATLTVERGLGFVPAEQLTRDKVPVGTILLDAIFSPIRRVNYEIENMRVGDRTDFNRLRITLETDGTVSPREAYIQALSILREHIDQSMHFESTAASDVAMAHESDKDLSSLVGLSVSARTQNALIEAGIKTAEELSKKTEGEILSIEGIGEKALGEIKKALRKNGLSLRSED